MTGGAAEPSGVGVEAGEGFPEAGLSRALVVALAAGLAEGFPAGGGEGFSAGGGERSPAGGAEGLSAGGGERSPAGGGEGASLWPEALRRHHVRPLADLPDLSDTAERPITADQTNRSVVVGERVVVKWFRPPTPPPHRALDLLAHLAAVGFDRTPTTYAALVDPDRALAALVSAYLPDAVDGWEWCVDAMVAGEPVGTLLGELAADLHAALATPSPTLPAPVQPSDGSGWHERAIAALDDALALTDDAWLHGIAPRLCDELSILAEQNTTPVLRIHGDLHVGQVLRWKHGHAIVDFDGNPTVAGDAPQPAARDVAQMRTSIEHVGQIAIRRRGAEPAAAAAWVGAERAAFDRAYRSRLADHGRSELLDERLLAPFAVEQECRELVYAARYLPRWRYAPMGVLRSWLEGGS